MNKKFMLLAGVIALSFGILVIISNGNFIQKFLSERAADQFEDLGSLGEQHANDYWNSVTYSDFRRSEYKQPLQEFTGKEQVFSYHAPIIFDFNEQDKCCIGWKVQGEGKEVGEVYVANGFWNYDKTHFFEKLNVVESIEHYKFSDFNIKQIKFTGDTDSGIYYAESSNTGWPKAFVITGYGQKPLSSDGQAVVEQYFISEQDARVFLQSVLESHKIIDVSAIETQIEKNINSVTNASSN